MVTIGFLTSVSVAYNYINNISVTPTFDVKKTYGPQERQLLARYETSNSIANMKSAQFAALGGSTTWGSAMMPDNKNIIAEKNTWPHILEAELKLKKPELRVLNLGVVGASSDCSFGALKHFFNRHIETIIVHNGYNDLPIIMGKKDDKTLVLDTKAKTEFCMYRSSFQKTIYDFKRLLIFNFPITNHIFGNSMVNGDRDIFLGYEMERADNILKLNDEEMSELYVKAIDKFIASNKRLVAFAKSKEIQILYIIEPSIEPTFIPNGTSFRFPETALLLRDFHNQQQEALKLFVEELSDDQIAFFDARRVFTKQKALFYDEIHLNEMGNQLLGRALNDKLESLGWAG